MKGSVDKIFYHNPSSLLVWGVINSHSQMLCLSVCVHCVSKQSSALDGGGMSGRHLKWRGVHCWPGGLSSSRYIPVTTTCGRSYLKSLTFTWWTCIGWKDKCGVRCVGRSESNTLIGQVCGMSWNTQQCLLLAVQVPNLVGKEGTSAKKDYRNTTINRDSGNHLAQESIVVEIPLCSCWISYRTVSH